MTDQQPEALRLAAWLEDVYPYDERTEAKAAAELRRLHAINAQLVELLEEISRANAAQVAPVYSELARAAIAAAKEQA